MRMRVHYSDCGIAVHVYIGLGSPVDHNVNDVALKSETVDRVLIEEYNKTVLEEIL